MAKYTNEDVMELVGAIEREKGKVAFLTGAGCSLSAGIPLAKSLVEEINGKYSREICRKVPSDQRQDYGRCMGALTIDERKELLDPYFRKAKINWAHVALASLIHSGHIRRVLTFNFDQVFARACGLLGRYPAIYDFGVSPSDRTDYLADPCIIHLHGQGYGPVMLNSEKETKEHARRLSSLLEDTLGSCPLVVVGYSGEADKVFERLVAAYKGRRRVYWLGFEEEPKAHLGQFLDGEHKDYCHYIGGVDADAFLIALAQKIGCFPPTVFADPAGHLLEEIKDVAEFPLEMTESKVDLLKNTQERLRIEGQKLRLNETIYDVLRGDVEKISQNQNVTSLGEKSTALREINAWAHLMLGNAQVTKGQEMRSMEHFELAIREYKEALAIKPEMNEAFSNLGASLAGLANLKGDKTLFREAIAKHEAALAIQPKMPETLDNLGIALAGLANLESDEALFREAIAKHEAALAVRPTMITAFVNLGVALTGLAKLKSDETLFREAIARYEAALAIQPQMPEALDNQGAALSGLANLKNDEALFREAIAKHEAALALLPCPIFGDGFCGFRPEYRGLSGRDLLP